MISDIRDFRDRRAPYAPISSLERFFERIRDRSVPEHVDHAFLRKLGVASNNEYALLSALKYLAIVDDRGRPTDSYRDLQSADAFKPALERLVRRAYEDVFAIGTESRPLEELTEFFRRTSSPSQAKNAARFFLAVCRRAGIDVSPHPLSQTENQSAPGDIEKPVPDTDLHSASHDVGDPILPRAQSSERLGSPRELLHAKARLLEKLPTVRPDWSAAEYRSICDRFVEMLRHLDEA